MPQVMAPIAAIGSWLGTTAGAATVAAGVGAASTVASISQGNSANKAAKSAAADQAERNAKLANDLYTQKAGAESDANAIAARDAARNRQKALAVGAGGRRSTILTSPLGAVGTPAGGVKTLLGV